MLTIAIYRSNYTSSHLLWVGLWQFPSIWKWLLRRVLR